MFQLTGNAYKKLEEILQAEKKTLDEKLYIRLSMGIGWGGPQLKLALEEQPLSSDQIFVIDDLEILIHPNDFVYFEDTKLDYIKNVLGNGQYKLLKI